MDDNYRLAIGLKYRESARDALGASLICGRIALGEEIPEDIQRLRALGRDVERIARCDEDDARDIFEGNVALVRNCEGLGVVLRFREDYFRAGGKEYDSSVAATLRQKGINDFLELSSFLQRADNSPEFRETAGCLKDLFRIWYDTTIDTATALELDGVQPQTKPEQEIFGKS